MSLWTRSPLPGRESASVDSCREVMLYWSIFFSSYTHFCCGAWSNNLLVAVENMRLSPHRIESKGRLVSTLRALDRHFRRLQLVKVDFPGHGVEEVYGLGGTGGVSATKTCYQYHEESQENNSPASHATSHHQTQTNSSARHR
jgi:hypothetical protein